MIALRIAFGKPYYGMPGIFLLVQEHNNKYYLGELTQLRTKHAFHDRSGLDETQVSDLSTPLPKSTSIDARSTDNCIPGEP